MAIRARSLPIVLGFLTVLASGPFTPGAAGSYFDEPSSLEFAAIPSPPDEAVRLDLTPDLFVEPTPDPTGSESDPARAGETPGVDPWAEAFAESMRFEAVARPMPEFPEYPVVLNADVQYFLDRFTGSRRAVVETWMNRAGRYLGMIQDALRQHGLPVDLAFTAMIESGYDPLAVSRAGAKGLWQFMAKTARRYGLRVDRWVDERLDPEKSSVAAAGYLRDLYNQFGSWTLAQAAYNAGELTVARAIRVTGSSDFWVLNRSKLLRRETKDFVPAIQAATIIGRSPDQYGFEIGQGGPDEVERVIVPPSTDLRRLAAAAGISLQMLRGLNPVLVRGVTPPGTTWELTVPAGTRDGVLAALAPRRPAPTARAGASRRTGGTAGVHVVRPHDTVSAIAKLYGVSVADVLRWNRLDQQDRIHPGDRLRVADLR